MKSLHSAAQIGAKRTAICKERMKFCTVILRTGTGTFDIDESQKSSYHSSKLLMYNGGIPKTRINNPIVNKLVTWQNVL